MLKRIGSNSKVDGLVVVNNEGIPIKSTLDSTSTVQVRSFLRTNLIFRNSGM